VGIQFSKVSNIRGSADVWEAFGELLVPLYDSDEFTMVANGAVRWADYSGSGTIWAYKGGVELGFMEDQLRFRSTYSRDVRAANLAERFDRTGGFANVTDPRNLLDTNPANDATTYGVTTASGGNPNVNPEEADTWTAGVVVQPDVMPGFSVSVDYYNIEIADAISTVGTQSVVNRCFQDRDQAFCDLISLADGTTASPTSTATLVGSIVGDLYVNVAAAAVEGVDLETSYNSAVRIFGGDPESISLRVLASWLMTRSDTGSTGVTNDNAGSVGALPYADFKATASLNYRYGDFAGCSRPAHRQRLPERLRPGRPMRDPGVLREQPRPSVTYSTCGSATISSPGARRRVSANVTNLFDVDPPLTPAYIGLSEHASQANASLYDVLGRRYTLGVRGQDVNRSWMWRLVPGQCAPDRHCRNGRPRSARQRAERAAPRRQKGRNSMTDSRDRLTLTRRTALAGALGTRRWRRPAGLAQAGGASRTCFTSWPTTSVMPTSAATAGATTRPGARPLATQGMMFMHAYANSAVCTATRVALITGRYQYVCRSGCRSRSGRPTSAAVVRASSRTCLR
jgi:hypothetical protein